MKALYFDKTLSIKELPVPEPTQSESLIKVLMTGICATDREIVAGYMNFTGVPGHEFVGIVEKSDNPELIGKRVVGEINCACNTCEMCRRKLQRHCLNRTVLGISDRNGVLAEYCTLPNSNLFEVPSAIDDHHAVFTEPLAAAMEIGEQLVLNPEWETLIIGDGKLAALIAQVMRLKGMNLTVAGINPVKINTIRSWGIPVIEEKPQKKSYDLVIEASGNPEGWKTAVNCVRPRGTIVLKSTYHGNLDFNPAPVVVDEITVVGSRCGNFGPAIRLLETGCLDLESMISKIFTFENIDEAFEYSNLPEAMKVLVDFR